MVLPGRDGVPSPSAAGGGTPALPGRPNPATGRPSTIAIRVSTISSAISSAELRLAYLYQFALTLHLHLKMIFQSFSRKVRGSRIVNYEREARSPESGTADTYHTRRGMVLSTIHSPCGET